MATFARDCTVKAEWLMRTPFGLPVVPKAKSIEAKMAIRQVVSSAMSGSV